MNERPKELPDLAVNLQLARQLLDIAEENLADGRGCEAENILYSCRITLKRMTDKLAPWSCVTATREAALALGTAQAIGS